MQFVRSEHPVAALIPPTLSPEMLAPLAQRMEEFGIGEVWTAEDYFELAGYSSAAIMLTATKSLSVGLGIVSAVARHPSVTAMELGTLGKAFPGRITAGIGHGVPVWTKQMGLYPKSPLRVLRECCSIVRRLLDGETVTQHEGHFYCDEIHLTHSAPDVPMITGVIGPKSLALSAEVADGVLASVMATPEYIDFAHKNMTEAAAKAGKTELSFPVLAIYAADADDRERALNAAGHVVAHYIAATGATPLTNCLGWNEEAKRLQALGDPDQIFKEMPREWTERLAIAGTPDECAEKINALLEAGASQVALACAIGDEMDAQLKLASEKIMPAVA